MRLLHPTLKNIVHVNRPLTGFFSKARSPEEEALDISQSFIQNLDTLGESGTLVEELKTL
jgi:hypothetical protein